LRDLLAAMTNDGRGDPARSANQFSVCVRAQRFPSQSQRTRGWWVSQALNPSYGL